MQLNLFEPMLYKVRWRFRAATLNHAGAIASWSKQSFPHTDRALFSEQAALQLKERLQTLPNYAGGFEMIPAKPQTTRS